MWIIQNQNVHDNNLRDKINYTYYKQK